MGISRAESSALATRAGLGAAAALQKVLVLGPRKIGKTSLLDNLHHDLKTQGSGSRRVASVDFATALTIEDVRAHVASQLSTSTHGAIDESKRSLQEILRSATSSSRDVLILYDHLNAALEEGGFSDSDYLELFEFASDLRASWIVALSAVDYASYVDRLRKLKPAIEARASALFNRAVAFRLLQLSPSDAIAFATSLSRSRSLAPPATIGKMITDDVGGLPFLIDGAIRFMADRGASWPECRQAFLESVSPMVVRYYLASDTVAACGRLPAAVLPEAVEMSTGRVIKYEETLRNLGLLQPSASAVSPLLNDVVRNTRKSWDTARVHYVFIIDHENFWCRVRDWYRDQSTRAEIRDFRRGGHQPLFRLELEYWEWPMAYSVDHTKLWRYVLSQLKADWRSRFNIGDFGFGASLFACADFDKFPRAHKLVYRENPDFRFLIREPDRNSKRDSQATDFKIFSTIAFEMEEKLRRLGVPGHYIIISNDKGYQQVQVELRRLGHRSEHWTFAFAEAVPGYSTDPARIKLEEILALDEFGGFR